MKKNDKIITILGVIILIIASMGIYFYEYEETTGDEIVNAESIAYMTGEFKSNFKGSSITVTDSNPFYALVATPLAVHYNSHGEQEIIPMYVKNLEEPSESIIKLQSNQLNNYKEINLDDIGYDSPKNFSLKIAEKYWESSNIALLIKSNFEGYSLAVNAVPIASYLSIPVIVCDELDGKVIDVLTDLEVEKIMVCGDIEGYQNRYNYLKFDTAEQAVENTTLIVEEKFDEINYITLANPVDAFPPKVLDTKEIILEKKKILSNSMNKLPTALKSQTAANGKAYWTFEIPKDYKYALVKFEGINHEIEGVDEFGDEVYFSIESNTETAPTGLIITGATGGAGHPIRDKSGKILKDRVLQEAVLYDQGGVECTVKATGTWALLKEGELSGVITLEKLENPVYPLMKDLSSIAPYLASYHKGIVFAKEDFAFTADDDIITKDTGKTCPGFYVPRRNARLVPISNRHVYDNIHVPLNNLLADIANIDLDHDKKLEYLTEHYKNNPVYIALVGGATVLPNYIFQNHVEPFGDVNGDGKDDTKYWIGGGTPSDVMYGNIDPVRYDWSNQASDIYSEYPYMENIVGRITGWDVQDASALVVRNVFYGQIVEKLEEWRDKFGLLVGGGQDFQKPLIRYLLFGKLLNMVPHGEPMKVFNGYGEQSFLRTEKDVAEPLGFDVQGALYAEAMREGLSDESLTKIKQVTLFNKLFFNKNSVKKLAGEGNVKGQEIYESSNFIFANGHGCQNYYGMAGNELTSAGLFGPIFQKTIENTFVPALGGFMGPGGDLGKVGDYGTRDVSAIDFGPSFMWLESCVCGKVDGVYPKASSTQAHLHGGVASMVSASTGSNIGGGYLEPKNMKYDLPVATQLKYLKNKLVDWDRGNFGPAHFGFKMYGDLCEDLQENDVSVGLAFRNARNNYFTEDEINWEVWWTPPLIKTGIKSIDSDTDNLYNIPMSSSDKGKMMDSKYVTYQEYLLFGDPALDLYEPVNEG